MKSSGVQSASDSVLCCVYAMSDLRTITDLVEALWHPWPNKCRRMIKKSYAAVKP